MAGNASSKQMYIDKRHFKDPKELKVTWGIKIHGYIEDITCLRVDTSFIFECSTRYRVEHEKIKFVSTSGHVIFCLLYKQQNQGYFSNFPKISEHFPKISEDFSKFSEQCPKFIRTFPIISRKFLKLSEDFRRLPKVAECCRAIVEDVSIR